MIDNLKIAILQFDIVWEDISSNILKIDTLIKQQHGADIVVLPEMFSTGFLPNKNSLAETMGGDTIKWMSDTAVNNNFVLTGSLIIENQNKRYNRLIWASPDGSIEFYDKRHLFSFAKENEKLSQGTKRTIFRYKGWRILPQICYDLRFPVWSRNCNDYDIAIYVASWPSERAWVWEHLLIARAIENQTFVIGANRVGIDGNGLNYSGKSMIIDPTGVIIKQATDDSEQIVTAKLSYKQLTQWQTKFPAINDRDNFKLE